MKLGLPPWHPGEAGDDRLVTQGQELLIKFEPQGVGRHCELFPVELRALKGRPFVGIGNGCPDRWIGEVLEPGKLVTPALGDRPCKRWFKVAEKEEGLGGAKFLSHKQERWRWSQQDDCDRGLQCTRFCEHHQAFPKSAVAYLIVVLQEGHKRRGGEVAAGVPPESP